MRIVEYLVTFFSSTSNTKNIQMEVSNEAVIREREHTDSVVKSNQVNNYAIVVSKLTKKFYDFFAVRGISFTVKRGKSVWY